MSPNAPRSSRPYQPCSIGPSGPGFTSVPRAPKMRRKKVDLGNWIDDDVHITNIRKKKKKNIHVNIYVYIYNMYLDLYRCK